MRQKKKRIRKTKKRAVCKKKNFFSLIEILLVLFLIALIGSFVTFRITDALALRRFETNQQKLSFLIQTCQELALTHQVDIELLLQNDCMSPKVTCQISCEEGTSSFLKSFSKKKISFAPLFFESEKEAPILVTFYASGFVASEVNKIEIKDKKRKAVIDFYNLSYFLPPQKKQKPVHPFSLIVKKVQ